MEFDIHTTSGKLADFQRRNELAKHPASEAAVAKIHDRGKLTARERVLALLDPDSFTELDEFARHRTTAFGMDAKRPYTDGVITGIGTIDGRNVCVFSQDVTIFGGALGEVYGEKICKIMDLAMRTGVPIVPVGIGGSERVMPKGARFIRPRKLYVIVGAPLHVSTSGSGKEQRAAARELTHQLHAEMQRLFDAAQARAGC